MTALVGLRIHAAIVPSSVANMKKAGPKFLPFCVISNPFMLLLKTWPVGVPAPVFPGGGIATWPSFVVVPPLLL